VVNVETVVGCIRLEDKNFKGTDKCEYTDEPIKEIKRILGIQEKII
jgi:hypothetical protein